MRQEGSTSLRLIETGKALDAALNVPDCLPYHERMAMHAAHNSHDWLTYTQIYNHAARLHITVKMYCAAALTLVHKTLRTRRSFHKACARASTAKKVERAHGTKRERLEDLQRHIAKPKPFNVGQLRQSLRYVRGILLRTRNPKAIAFALLANRTWLHPGLLFGAIAVRQRWHAIADMPCCVATAEMLYRQLHKQIENSNAARQLVAQLHNLTNDGALLNDFAG